MTIKEATFILSKLVETNSAILTVPEHEALCVLLACARSLPESMKKLADAVLTAS